MFRILLIFFIYFSLFRLINNLNLMKKQWNVVPFYQDNCEYHYVLKFYNGKKLIKTLKVNLFCNYVTEDVFSYTFDPIWLTQRRSLYQNVNWSKFSFSDLPLFLSSSKENILIRYSNRI